MPSSPNNFVFGGVAYPLTTSSGNTLLRDADPSLYALLDFYSNMITTLIGARLVAAAAAALSPTLQPPFTSAVAYLLPDDPAKHVHGEQVKFPLLAIYRRSGELASRTTIKRHRICELEVAYVLPPLDEAQSELLKPILHTIGDVLDCVTELGFFPTYTPPFSGAAAGSSVWQPTGLAEVGFVSDTYGEYFGNDLVFPAWVGKLRLKEQIGAPTGLTPFAAVDIQVDLQSSDGTTVNAAVLDATDTNEPPEGYSAPPKVTSISPVTGPAAGGTNITVTGTGFRSGATVSIGGVLCTNIVVVSSMSITATTPAGTSGQIAACIVVNQDGQVGPLAAAFTYV